MEQLLKDTLLSFSNELKMLVQQSINQFKKDSSLEDSVQIKYENQSLSVYMNDYVQYIQSGRKPFSKKIPIDALIVFIKSKNINLNGKSINSVAFAMQQSIYKNGIKGMPILDSIDEVSTEYVSKSIDNFFNSNEFDIYIQRQLQ